MAHLVFQTAFPGDLFLSVPLIKKIKEWDPGTEVVLACRPGLGEFFLKNRLADEIITINKRDKKQSAEVIKAMAAREWDVVFVPHQSFRTALMIRPLRAKHKVSFASWWNRPFFDKRVVKPMDFPDALRQLSLLTPLDSRIAEQFASDEVQALRNPARTSHGLDTAEAPELGAPAGYPFEDFRKPPIPEWASMQVLQPAREGRVVFMAPGSTWNTKRWTARGYQALGARLLREGYSLELVGSKDERALCDEIMGGLIMSLGKTGGTTVVNRAGLTSLYELALNFRRGTALISNDSGSMHAAAAAGLPTIAIFGPTTLDLGFRPWQNRALVVQLDLDCRPCGKHGHDKCPLGHHNCMEKIEADVVFKAFRDLIGTGPLNCGP